MVTQCLKEFESRLDKVSSRVPGQPRQEVVLSRLYYMVFKRLQETINHNLQPYGINDSMWTALVMMYSSPEHFIYPSDLSHVTISSRTHITRLADEMVSKGWVSRQGCQTDRRKVILRLTQSGTRLVETILPRQWALYEKLWQSFDATEKDQMEAMQRKLLATLSKQLPATEKHHAA